MREKSVSVFFILFLLISTLFVVNTAIAIVSAPTSQQNFTYPAIQSPILSDDPSLARPIGVGSVAIGGITLSIQLNLKQFEGEVDTYVGYIRQTAPQTVNILNPDRSFSPFNLSEIVSAISTGTPFSGFQPWMPNTFGPIDEDLFDIPISSLPNDTYTAYLLVAPAGSLDNYYLWITSFEIPSLEAFYVYKDYDSPENHFYPSGWMGDDSAISFDDSGISNCYSGLSCINITFTAEESNWTGIYWQDPEHNWGENPDGGFDLTGCNMSTFVARGENGGEVIEFFSGGIEGSYGDSFSKTSTGFITLTQNWEEYIIDLTGNDMSHVIGGFGWALNSDDNPLGATFSLDEIKYECLQPVTLP